jgi:hypothetical protein
MQPIPSKRPSLFYRIKEETKRIEQEVARLEPGVAYDAQMKKLRQLDVAAHVEEWLSSPGLQAPR